MGGRARGFRCCAYGLPRPCSRLKRSIELKSISRPYNNFPEERELFAACQGHWMELHPPPRYDPAEGAEAVLRSVYGWYRETARMAENVRRDRASVPALDALMSETADAQLAALAQALGGGPLTALALDFWTWRRLAAEGLDDDEAAAVMARAIECA